MFAGPTLAQEKTVDAYFFHGQTCGYCHREAAFLDKLEEELPYLALHRYEVWNNEENATLITEVGKQLKVRVNSVPIFFVGEQHYIGFGGDSTTGQSIRESVVGCYANECKDLIKPVIYSLHMKKTIGQADENPSEEQGEVKGDEVVEPGADEPKEIAKAVVPAEAGVDPADDEAAEDDSDVTGQGTLNEPGAGQVEGNARGDQKRFTVVDELTYEEAYGEEKVEKVNLPFIGYIDVQSFSLPLLTIIIAGLDGFNPCAMWVLLFLISLLLGMKNKKRMWILGSAFIVSSGVVYFLFLTAWLNVFLFIGFIFWVRIGIGVVAIASGAYHLREYYLNRPGCKVTEDEKRQKIFAKLKAITQRKEFFYALIGIILLAVAVNVVELVCSAGLPAVYTSILAMTDLATWQYYMYLVLYIFIFMLDDLIIFFLAMGTLQMVGISKKYSRFASLIGGIIILILGLLLIFKPTWLIFG